MGEITDSATSAAGAVDNITNAPIKAVNSVTSRLKSYISGRNASAESAQLAGQREEVAKALKEYKGTNEAKTAEKAAEPAAAPEAKAAEKAEVPAAAPEASVEDKPKTYVEVKEGSDEELVIDPRVIAESSFFTEESNAK